MLTAPHRRRGSPPARAAGAVTRRRRAQRAVRTRRALSPRGGAGATRAGRRHGQMHETRRALKQDTHTHTKDVRDERERERERKGRGSEQRRLVPAKPPSQPLRCVAQHGTLTTGMVITWRTELKARAFPPPVCESTSSVSPPAQCATPAQSMHPHRTCPCSVYHLLAAARAVGLQFRGGLLPPWVGTVELRTVAGWCVVTQTRTV